MAGHTGHWTLHFEHVWFRRRRICELPKYRQSLSFGQPTLVYEMFSQELGIGFSASMLIVHPELLVGGTRRDRLWDLHKGTTRWAADADRKTQTRTF